MYREIELFNKNCHLLCRMEEIHLRRHFSLHIAAFLFFVFLGAAKSLSANQTITIKNPHQYKTIKNQPSETKLLSITVPDIRNYDLSRAINLLKKRKTDLVIKVSSKVFHPTLPINHIISQDPMPGSSVLPKSSLNVVVSKGPASTVKFRKAPHLHPLAKLTPSISSEKTGKKATNPPNGVNSTPLQEYPRKIFIKATRLRQTKVKQGYPIEICLKNASFDPQRATFLIGNHKLMSRPAKGFHKILIPTRGIPPGYYPLIVFYAGKRSEMGKITILPAARGKQVHRQSAQQESTPSKHPKVSKGKPKTPSFKAQASINETKPTQNPTPQIRPRNKKPQSLVFTIQAKNLSLLKRTVAKNAPWIKIKKSRLLRSLNVVIVHIQTSNIKMAKQIARQLSSRKIILRFQSNYLYRTHGAVEDPYANRQYGCLPLKKLFAIQSICKTKTIDVALLDTGVDIYHEDLNASKIETKDFTDESFGRFLTDIHGTAVCGIISAIPENGKGIIGLAPFAKIHAIKVCKSISPLSVQATTDTFTLATGLDYVIQKRFPLVNISIGGPKDWVIEKLVRKACSRGTIIVAAVGNSGPRAPPSYPAAYPGVIGVSAVDQNLKLYPKAYQGRSVDIAAPGVDVFSLKPGSRYNFYTGTSFATAYVTGILSLKLSCSNATSPLGRKELLSFLQAIVFHPASYRPERLGIGVLILSKIAKKLF